MNLIEDLGPKRIAVHILLTVLCLGCLATSLYSRAEIIDLLVSSGPSARIVAACAFYLTFHFLGSGFRMLEANLRNFAQVDSMQRALHKLLPKKIERATVDKAENYFQHMSQTFSELSDLRLSLIYHLVVVVTVLGFYLYKVISDQFWIALVFVAILTPLSLVAGSAYNSALGHAINRLKNQHIKFLQWTSYLFKSHRERVVNWQQEGASSFDGSFRHEADLYASEVRKVARVSLKKSGASLLLLDLPSLLCLGVITLAAAFGKIGIADAIIWAGISDYLLQANNSLGSIRSAWAHCRLLETQVSEDLSWVAETAKESVKPSFPALERAQFTLRDGNVLELGIKPGLYHIQAQNGAGKSTLFDALLGLQSNYGAWDPKDIGGLGELLKGRVRIVEKDASLLPHSNCFWQQIFGEVSSVNDKQKVLKIRLRAALGHELAENWIEIIFSLADSWESRTPRDLSSGERVILSFARALSGWTEDTRVLIVDEADAFLDTSRRCLFAKTLDVLANSVAIYYVSHREKGRQSLPLTSLSTSVFVLGYNSLVEQATVLECRLKLKTAGKGTIAGFGSIGRLLQDDLGVVRSAFEHTDPRFAYLLECDLTIECHAPGYTSEETRSARLALAAGLLNFDLMLSGRAPLAGVAATALVNLDGGIEPAGNVEAKTQAAQAKNYVHHIFCYRKASSLGAFMSDFLRLA